jgi:phage shock protein C
MQEARLMRSTTDKMLAGVCGGLAVYLGVDSVFVRLAFVLLGFASGIGIPLYIILMLIMPSESTVDAPPSKVMQENIEQMGSSFNSSVKRVRQHPQGPRIAAGLLILLGVYLLLDNVGWLAWLSGGTIAALVLIGLGIYLVASRSK